jgi:hypothetical protein
MRKKVVFLVERLFVKLKLINANNLSDRPQLEPLLDPVVIDFIPKHQITFNILQQHKIQQHNGFTGNQDNHGLFFSREDSTTLLTSTIRSATTIASIMEQSNRALQHLHCYQSFHLGLGFLPLSGTNISGGIRDKQELLAGRQMLEYSPYHLQCPLRYLCTLAWP